MMVLTGLMVGNRVELIYPDRHNPGCDKKYFGKIERVENNPKSNRPFVTLELDGSFKNFTISKISNIARDC